MMLGLVGFFFFLALVCVQTENLDPKPGFSGCFCDDFGNVTSKINPCNPENPWLTGWNFTTPEPGLALPRVDYGVITLQPSATRRYENFMSKSFRISCAWTFASVKGTTSIGNEISGENQDFLRIEWRSPPGNMPNTGNYPNAAYFEMKYQMPGHAYEVDMGVLNGEVEVRLSAFVTDLLNPPEYFSITEFNLWHTGLACPTADELQQGADEQCDLTHPLAIRPWGYALIGFASLICLVAMIALFLVCFLKEKRLVAANRAGMVQRQALLATHENDSAETPLEKNRNAVLMLEQPNKLHIWQENGIEELMVAKVEKSALDIGSHFLNRSFLRPKCTTIWTMQMSDRNVIRADSSDDSKRKTVRFFLTALSCLCPYDPDFADGSFFGPTVDGVVVKSSVISNFETTSTAAGNEKATAEIPALTKHFYCMMSIGEFNMVRLYSQVSGAQLLYDRIFGVLQMHSNGVRKGYQELNVAPANVTDGGTIKNESNIENGSSTSNGYVFEWKLKGRPFSDSRSGKNEVRARLLVSQLFAAFLNYGAKYVMKPCVWAGQPLKLTKQELSKQLGLDASGLSSDESSYSHDVVFGVPLGILQEKQDFDVASTNIDSPKKEEHQNKSEDMVVNIIMHNLALIEVAPYNDELVARVSNELQNLCMASGSGSVHGKEINEGFSYQFQFEGTPWVGERLLEQLSNGAEQLLVAVFRSMDQSGYQYLCESDWIAETKKALWFSKKLQKAKCSNSSRSKKKQKDANFFFVRCDQGLSKIYATYMPTSFVPTIENVIHECWPPGFTIEQHEKNNTMTWCLKAAGSGRRALDSRKFLVMSKLQEELEKSASYLGSLGMRGLSLWRV